MGKTYRDKKNFLLACPASGRWGMRRQPRLLQKKRAVKDILAVLQHIETRKLAENTLGKPTERRANFLPPYAAQNQLAVMISCRTFTACDLDNKQWRPLVVT